MILNQARRIFEVYAPWITAQPQVSAIVKDLCAQVVCSEHRCDARRRRRRDISLSKRQPGGTAAFLRSEQDDPGIPGFPDELSISLETEMRVGAA